MSKKEIHTHYANTDMEIVSNLEPLALKAVFHQHQFFDMTERTQRDGSWLGRYQTYKQYKEPDANLAGFLEVIEGLEGAALDEWPAMHTARVRHWLHGWLRAILLLTNAECLNHQ